jgi:nitrite reductase/ring-hydroxylating ferredoxin subunit
MSSQLTDLPLAIRIFGEDLVAFRDRSGRIGVLHRHCCHRGASLEYGVIQERGIRCCYHGMQFDVDGTLLDVPTEPDRGARLKKTVAQGAYPAIERDGLVFSYLGPADTVPPFCEWDAFEKYDDVRLVPFLNTYPCNWLQVTENIADQLHTATLHQPGKVLYGGQPPAALNVEPFTVAAFSTLPIMDYVPVRGGTAMAFIAGRRMTQGTVWWRINECALPNMTHHAYIFEDGRERRLFHRVHLTRWHVPVDDTKTIIFGWRMFGNSIDPYSKGREDRVGIEDMDFLDGQVGNRPYHEAQRLPGDWEAIVSQRPIAVHALEHPISSDAGVYLYRKLLRDAVRQTNPGAHPDHIHERLTSGLPLHTYTQNTVLNVPQRTSSEEDVRIIRAIGRSILDATAAGDSLKGETRRAFIKGRLEELELAHSE